jgi:hypothetical protein
MLALLGCAGSDPLFGSADARSWSGLWDGASWTWREDALGRVEGTEAPDTEALTLGKHLGDGRIELRVGSRWADAAEVGELVFSDDDGIALESWDLQGSQGTGPLQISEPELVDGITAFSPDYSCTLDSSELVETWYGDFQLAAVFDCAGAGLSGTWAFAEGVGLIQARVGEIQLDLVAPY